MHKKCGKKLSYINYSRKLIIYNKTYTCEHVQYLMTAILTGAMQVTVFIIEIRVQSNSSLNDYRTAICDLQLACLACVNLYMYGVGEGKEKGTKSTCQRTIYISIELDEFKIMNSS